jgi:hypothetical protein
VLLLFLLNHRTEQKGIDPIFENVTKIKPDNGEKFVSAYFKQQLVRNRRKESDKKTKQCTCQYCLAPAVAAIVTVAPTAAAAPTRNDNPPLLVKSTSC